MIEYSVVTATGAKNVEKAVRHFSAEHDPQWRLHSIVENGIGRVVDPLGMDEDKLVPKFILIFEKEITDG